VTLLDSKTKAVAAIAIIGAGAGALFLISQARAQASKTAPVQIQIQSNPIPTILSVDGVEIETPATIMLSPGVHTFAAVPKSPDLLITYGFDKWQLNGVTVGYMTTTQINITGPSVITAQFMMIEAGVNSPAALPSSANLPLTPNLINPNLNIVVEI
jgi:hypothetical protein